MYGWIQAMDEALVTTHLGTAETSDSYDTAKRKLGELIDWHVAVALDERVNGGYRLVPVEPTPSMRRAGEHAKYHGCDIEGVYADMLAAAPKPEDE